MIFIDEVDYIFWQNYFEDEENPINFTKQHDNSKSNTKSYRRTKEHVKNTTHKSYVGPKETITNIYQQPGGYFSLCCCSDFPRNRKEIRHSRYTEKTQTSKDIIEVNGFYKMERKGFHFIRNVCVAPEKIVSLMANRQLYDIKRFCTSNTEVPIEGIDLTHNKGPLVL